jgi:heme oxygenase (biliverdin-IX-beta and delta-forming)
MECTQLSTAERTDRRASSRSPRGRPTGRAEQRAWPVSSPALRDALRSTTSEAHRTLEATPLMVAVAAELPSPQAYAAYLGCQWQLHAPLESLLLPWVEPAWATERLGKTRWIEDDLRALGLPLPAEPAQVEPFTRRAQVLGVLYVLEGATLGLHVVTRRLPPEHPARTRAGRFMMAYGEETGRRWGEFLRELTAVEHADWPEVCSAAIATFGAFQRVFERAWPCPSDTSP